MYSILRHIILSHEVGERKPNKRSYLDALNAVQLEEHDEPAREGTRAVERVTMLARQGSRAFYEAKDLDFKPGFERNCMSEIA